MAKSHGRTEPFGGSVKRRFPIGAEVLPGKGVHFRVWAPKCKKAEVVIEEAGRAPSPVELVPEGAGYYSTLVREAGDGTLYRFRLDGGPLVSDPASRFQPEGPHGPSEVVDPFLFKWTDSSWKGVGLKGRVLYEMHIGAFTREGTWTAAERQLPELADIGITVLEVMPVADYPGRFGWGYDGVNFYAPTRLYGAPDDFRSFVNAAHGLGIGVILDVVYNHAGPEGSPFSLFSDHYFSSKHTDWGATINYDGRFSAPVREFVSENAGYWIEEYHLDGLRLDATQNIHDSSEKNIMAEIAERSRRAAKGRSLYIIAENEMQEIAHITPIEEGGYGLDAVWNDDFHHSATVALTGKTEGYYADYKGTPQELISAVKRGYIFQGQYFSFLKKDRGKPAFGFRPESFINFLQNHDQVSNTGTGRRIHTLTSPGRYRALSALLLLAPSTPLIFQGQEFCSSSPFPFFSDLSAGLMDSVKKGRATFLKNFQSLASPEAQSGLPVVDSHKVFEASILDFNERTAHKEAYSLYKDLLRIRRSDGVIRIEGDVTVDGAVLGPSSFLIRFFGGGGEDRLLVINLGPDLMLTPAPEPLLAPPSGGKWELMWSSESPAYGGGGTPFSDMRENWRISAESAVLYKPVKP